MEAALATSEMELLRRISAERMLSDEEMLTTFDAVRVANPLLATALGDGLAGDGNADAL